LKKIKTKTSDYFFILASCLLLVACSKEVPKGKEQIIIPTDTVFIAADSSQQVMLHSLIEVYEALNPLRKVIPIYNREKKLYDYMRGNKVDVILRSYLLTDTEKKNVKTRKLNPKLNLLWTDGLAVIASNDFKQNVWREEELKAVLTHQSNAFHLIIDNSSTATYDLIYDTYAVDQTQANAYAAGSEDSVISAVSTHTNYIGLIGSSYFTVAKESLPKGVKLLGLIPMGQQKAEYPFQDQLYNGVYPLSRPLYAINIGAVNSFGSAFVSFILSERGQRIILKAGLLPAKIPPRTIELVSE
jgi:phosphate transport system substrate-binding protein